MNIPVEKIQCRESLVTLKKYDGSSACVESSTAERLIERGWSVSKSYTRLRIGLRSPKFNSRIMTE